MCILYLRGIYYIYILNKSDIPTILLNDLSLFSNYRYLFLTIFSVFSLFFGVISFYVSSFKKMIDIISYPFVKEEIRNILYTWHSRIFGPACNYLYSCIINSNSFSVIFFSLHFIAFYLFRFIICLLLVNFVFFNGNLSYIMYLLPFSFIIWLMGFFDYYFKYFREGTRNYILELLKVQYKNSLTILDYQRGFVDTTLNNFTFSLTPIALSEGYTLKDLNYLIKTWTESATIDLKFQQYYKSLKFFNIFLLFLLFACWFFISYTFISGSNNISFLWFPFLSRLSMRPIWHEFLRQPRVREGASMNNVKQATNDAVSPGHPAIGERDGTDIRVDAAITHKPPTNLPSVHLSNTGVPPDPKTVYAVPVPGGPVKIPQGYFESKPIPNSQSFCESSLVKPKLEAMHSKNDTE